MKYNRIILSAVIALVMMLAPLPCFGKTDVLQYTADSSNAESWQSCDSSQSVTFEQNKKIYLRFSAAESDVLPVNRTMKKYKICVTIILNFLLVIF